MFLLQNIRVLVAGLGRSGLAAAELSLRRGARVTGVDSATSPALEQTAARLRGLGAEVILAAEHLPPAAFDLAVVSPGVPLQQGLGQEITARSLPLVGELELGYEHALCPNIGITGTNGKTTTTELVERILTHCHLRTVAAGNIGRPLCTVVDQTKELDYLTLEVSSFQLETIQQFRPTVGVVMNLTPDHLERYAGMADYIRAKARLFLNQQAFDWAIVQSEALAQMRSLGVVIPSKVLTFSANNRRADLWLDRGLLVSRIEGWEGPLFDMNQGRLRGPHNAENIMAALAVGRCLRLPLEGMLEAIRSYTPAPHRCEPIAEVGGVKYVNDSKATNLDAVAKALLTMPVGPQAGEPNVWLIAGGKDKGFEFHDIGPLLSRRVKGAFLLGETREKIRAAWSLFTPCTLSQSLLEAVVEAARQAVPGDVVLLSPACSSFDQFRNYEHRGEVFRQAVQELAARQVPGPGGTEVV